MTCLIYGNILVIISVTVLGPREGETSLKNCVNYQFCIYKLSKLHRKSPKRFLQNLESLENLPKAAIYPKIRQNSLGRFPLTRAQAACLVRPFVYIFFCDTVAGTLFTHVCYH
jgi:hypothetical protein